MIKVKYECGNNMSQVWVYTRSSVKHREDMVSEMYERPTMNQIKISNDHEGTASPYWVIIDPRQNFRTDIEGVYNISNMITGPFFSRETAEEYLKKTRYNFGRNAIVFCMSGCYSQEWCDAIRIKGGE